MKKLVLIMCCWLVAISCINAQTLEQKKICALKWTLQQTFYNKEDGQKIAHLDVTKYKTLADFQKDKVISGAIKKITNPSDQSRVNNILSATPDNDIESYVPSGGKSEYKNDVEKIKNVTPGEEPSEDEESEEVQEKPKKASEEITVASEEEKAEAKDSTAEDEDASAEPEGGMSFLAVAGISLGIYVVLSLCIFVFVRSRRSTQKEEDTVSMEQYRSERLRLIERIKSVEIEVENIKSLKAEKPSPVQAPKPVQPQPVVPESKPVSSDLFTETKPTVAPAPESPAEKPVRNASSSVLFFPVPVDGVFSNGTTEIEVGKSLYMLKTADGEVGTFQILNTPEAISAALVSLSDMVKPVCKIINTVAAPVEILAEKSGQAVREGENWRVTAKAVVRLI